MTLNSLNKIYDQLQLKFGDNNLNSVYGGGCYENPNVCFVFMNPTAKNIATNPSWKGVRYQWLGTKQVWKFFNKLGFVSNELLSEISNKKASEWTNEFCKRVYGEVSNNSVYITNLAKCSQSDAKPLPNKVFFEYKKYLLKELDIVNPKKLCFLAIR